MNINRRISKLENSQPNRIHGIRFIEGQKTEQEAVAEYCNKHGFDPDRFMREEYGKVIIIKRSLV